MVQLVGADIAFAERLEGEFAIRIQRRQAHANQLLGPRASLAPLELEHPPFHFDRFDGPGQIVAIGQLFFGELGLIGTPGGLRGAR